MTSTAKRRRTSPLPPAEAAGYSLVEVIVAMLISCIMVTAVMGVAVTSKQGSGKSMRRMMFDQGIAQLSAEIKQYVTACGCQFGGACPAATCYYAGPPPIQGPNTNRAGVATWYINGAPGANGNLVDSAGDVWALKCGAHTITNVFPPLPSPAALEAAPYNGSITYTVTWPAGGCNPTAPGLTDVPTIQFAANWTEP